MQPGAATIPCPNCGRALPVGARFCADCGKPLAPAQAATPAADPRFPRPPTTPTPEPRFPAPAPQPPRPDGVPLVDPLSSQQSLVPQTGPASPTVPAQTPAPAQPTPAWQAAAPVGQPMLAAPFAATPASAPTLYSAPPVSNQQSIAPVGLPSAGNQFSAGAGQSVAAPPMQFPPPVAQSPRKRSFLSRQIGKVVLLLVLVALIGGGVGIFFLLRGGTTPSTLPSDIPLPPNNSFVKQDNQTWYYTVSTTTLKQVADFYQTQLPQQGWLEPDTLTSSGGFSLITCNQTQEVDIVGDISGLGGVSAPAGGMVLKITEKPKSPVSCSSP